MMGMIDEFDRILKERWSYFFTVDREEYEEALEQLRRDPPTGDLAEFLLAFELHRILCLGIDGHAYVGRDTGRPGIFAKVMPPDPGGLALDVSLAPNDGRLIALDPFDDDRLLDADAPFLKSIQGIPLERWKAAVRPYLARGSAAFVKSNETRRLRFLEFFARQLEIQFTDRRYRIVFEGPEENEFAAERTLEDLVSSTGRLPLRRSELFDRENLGYIRLPDMGPDAKREISARMDDFRETDGLIVDVRDNTGGRREALVEFYSYIAAPDSAPRVVNVARHHTSYLPEHLTSSNRQLFPADSPTWNADARSAIEAFARDFSPVVPNGVAIPDSKFSDPHYMVLEPQAAPGSFHYDRAVVILMNHNCFSATDIFLSALKGVPSVTLMGTPSGGGSAFSQQMAISNVSGVSIGSMISFQADGRTFDGFGVEPDEFVEATAEAYDRRSDIQLETAVELLLRG